jgi:hypothetical protein
VSLLLQQGESPVYVQRQLGHASIKHTVDTHGKWLPMGNREVHPHAKNNVERGPLELPVDLDRRLPLKRRPPSIEREVFYEGVVESGLLRERLQDSREGFPEHSQANTPHPGVSLRDEGLRRLVDEPTDERICLVEREPRERLVQARPERGRYSLLRPAAPVTFPAQRSPPHLPTRMKLRPFRLTSPYWPRWMCLLSSRARRAAHATAISVGKH